MFPHYPAPIWLKGGGHLQTIYPKVLALPSVSYRRELLRDSTHETAVAYDFIDAPQANAPVVVLFHGLEGSSHSHYALSLMDAVKQKQWHGVVVHYRGCGGVVNQSHKAYHSGDSLECEWMLQQLRQRYPNQKLYVMGVSLGGNMLAKYLGEAQNLAIPDAAAVISAPLDLTMASVALEKGLSKKLYAPYFLRSLLPKAKHEQQQGQHPHLRWDDLLASSGLKDFDQHYTAPVHGFDNADSYYRLSSAKPVLRHIQIPTLIINAQNDPFLPPKALPTAADVSECVTLYQPHHGGHVGFVSGLFPGNLQWLPQTVLTFFSEHA